MPKSLGENADLSKVKINKSDIPEVYATATALIVNQDSIIITFDKNKVPGKKKDTLITEVVIKPAGYNNGQTIISSGIK